MATVKKKKVSLIQKAIGDHRRTIFSSYDAIGKHLCVHGSLEKHLCWCFKERQSASTLL